MKQTDFNITILTDPLIYGSDSIEEFFRSLARDILLYLGKYFKKFQSRKVFRGHFAVTRSLVEGLQKKNINVNYNPKDIKYLSKYVIVLAGVRTLKQAIKLKKAGLINKLFAGPNIVTFASDFNYLIADPKIDCYLLNSEWTEKLYLIDCPELKGHTYIWPAGVDISYWKPNSNIKKSQILIFDKRLKTDDPDRIFPYIEYLNNMGCVTKIITRTETISYTQEEYLSLLQSSCLMIGFTVGSESQGLAWAEAWSCDVPTFILKNEISTIQGRVVSVSTAPYLTDDTGLFFEDLNDFKMKFESWENGAYHFQPRNWVMKNMSDEVCAKNLYEQIIDFQ